MMKRIILPVVVLLSLVVGSSFASAAATAKVVLSPATRAVVAGQTFTMTVTISPTGSTVYTAKVAVQYPANLLEAKSFVYTNGWLPLSQTGYDNIDNTTGTLIKTAGFQGGLTADKILGTITFKAKAAGTATVSLGGGTMLLDASNANTFSNGVSAAVVVKAATSPTPNVAVAPSESPVAVATETPTNDDQLAAVTESSGGFATKKIVGIAVLVLALAVAYRWKRRK